jgi:hypothetical protein
VSVGMQLSKAILPRSEQCQYIIPALMSMAPDPYNTCGAGGCRWGLRKGSKGEAKGYTY